VIQDVQTINLIEKAIAELRPFFERDGGDIRLVEITDDWVVKVQLIGACSNCEMSPMTLKAGIEESVKKVVPQITKVEAIQVEETPVEG